MKSRLLLPALTAAIGFSVAWIVKPASTAQHTETANAAGKPVSGKNPRPDSPRDRPRPGAGQRPAEPDSGAISLAEAAEQGPKTREEARMLRLTEALGLSIDQQGEILKAIEQATAATGDPLSGIEDLAAKGRRIEEALAKVLTPAQLAAFAALRERERENRIEARAQRGLMRVIEEIDLSAAQRDETLARLRLAEKRRIQSIPAAATLLLDTSVLPVGPGGISVDGALSIARLTEPANLETPLQAFQHMQQQQRENLEEKLQCFDGILSPGQMGQYHAILAEERALLERLPRPPGE